MSKVKETSTHFENKMNLNECDQIFAVGLISGQWTLLICCHLAESKLRFGELKKRMPNITERMLTHQLRKMEEGGLVKRTVYAEVPPRVEYELTKSGQELRPILKQLHEWGKKHRKVTNAEKRSTSSSAVSLLQALSKARHGGTI